MRKPLTQTMIFLFAWLLTNAASADVINIFSLDGNRSLVAVSHNKPAVECRYELIEAYTGSLLIQSKYDQSDATKSRMKKDLDPDSLRIKSHVQNFSKKLVTYADYAINSKDYKKSQMANSCYQELFTHWAKQQALLTNKTSKTGIAIRKWTLAIISTTVIKLMAASDGKYELNSVQKEWVDALATKVIKDYDERLQGRSPRINNHDYWAAWAVVASAIALNKDAFLDWGLDVFDYAMGQISVPAGMDFGYLPNEIARASLAANYINYSLVPLVFLAVAAQSNQRLQSGQATRLGQLVNFSSLIVLDNKRLGSVLKQKQEPVKNYKYIWLYPFLNAFPEHELARKLFVSLQGDVDRYSQAGGSIKIFYKNVY